MTLPAALQHWKENGYKFAARAEIDGREMDAVLEQFEAMQQQLADAERFEALTEKQSTVAAYYHDSYDQWQVCTDPQRRVMESCRFEGWGDTLAEATANLAENPNTNRSTP